MKQGKKPSKNGKQRFGDQTNPQKKKGRNKSANSSNRRDRDDREMVDRPENKITNSPDFWMGLGQYSKDVSRISTLQPIGSKLPAPWSRKVYWTPSGVTRFDYLPFFGTVDSAVDAINIAAKKLYDEINSKNSRNPSYDPSDLMIYVIAVANAWAIHSFVKRIVGMYNTFIPLNKYWWNTVANSMTISEISTQEDIIKWRNLCNRMALKLNNLIVPDNIPYFKRAYMMSEFIYADAPVAKASLFYFAPASLLKYEYDSEQVGRLINEVTPWADNTVVNKVTPTMVEDYFNRMTVNLFNDSDINTMSADIMKAYGLEHCFRLPMIDESYSLLPFYDEMLSSELHNARMCYALYDSYESDKYVLKQDMNMNCLVSDYTCKINREYGDAAVLYNDAHDNKAVPLDFWKDNPSEEEVMEATRLLYIASNYDDSEDAVHPTVDLYACCEILIMDTFYEFGENTFNDWHLEKQSGCVYPVVGTSMPVYLDKLSKASKLSSSPLVITVLPNNASTVVSKDTMNPTAQELVCDTTNYTVIDKVTLKNMHDAATLSIFLPRH